MAQGTETKSRGTPDSIIRYPDPRLKKVSPPWTDFSEKGQARLRRLFVEMAEALGETKWGGQLGIAAPQVGINERLVIVQGVPMVNPTFTPSKAPKGKFNEGCYSMEEGKVYTTWRVSSGWAKWQDVKGEEWESKCNDIKALVMQHEINHLDGILCSEIQKT